MNITINNGENLSKFRTMQCTMHLLIIISFNQHFNCKDKVKVSGGWKNLTEVSQALVSLASTALEFYSSTF